MKNCPGCLKAGHVTYCLPCRKRLFGGKKVSHVLTFSRPVYDQARLAVSGRRLSISGIQTKMPLALREGRLELTETGGQYILKPIPHGAFRNLSMTPVNEHLTMQIARQVFGISVAENALVEFQKGSDPFLKPQRLRENAENPGSSLGGQTPFGTEGEMAYLVRRFDVQEDGSRRLQEDFAQIAGRSEESHGKNYKYDFSYEEIGELIRKHVAAYPVEMERFFQLVVFNYLICNGDAHLKNFSLIRNEEYGDYTLTPAYDLLNTRLHVPDETRTALPMFKDDFETQSYQPVEKGDRTSAACQEPKEKGKAGKVLSPFSTGCYQANGFYAYDDFEELGKRLELHQARCARIMQGAVAKEREVFSLIDRSELSDECKQAYKDGVRDSIRALSYSHAESRRAPKISNPPARPVKSPGRRKR